MNSPLLLATQHGAYDAHLSRLLFKTTYTYCHASHSQMKVRTRQKAGCFNSSAFEFHFTSGSRTGHVGNLTLLPGNGREPIVHATERNSRWIKFTNFLICRMQTNNEYRVAYDSPMMSGTATCCLSPGFQSSYGNSHYHCSSWIFSWMDALLECPTLKCRNSKNHALNCTFLKRSIK